MLREVGALWHLLTKQPVGVLVRPLGVILIGFLLVGIYRQLNHPGC
jgi:hypothetical protein